MELKVKRLTESAKMPVYATDGAGCFDLAADIVRPITVYPSEAEMFCTGLQVEVPAGYVLELYSRSGHGFKNSLRLINCVGIIDSDFRGEVMAKIRNDGERPYTIEPGERIIQGKLTPAPQTVFVEVNELSATVRDASGFGSTGTTEQPSLFHPDEEISRRLANDA